ncbi:MAG: hypothetical protein AAF732_07715 [Pseudomonadota bacterium]
MRPHDDDVGSVRLLQQRLSARLTQHADWPQFVQTGQPSSTLRRTADFRAWRHLSEAIRALEASDEARSGGDEASRDDALVPQSQDLAVFRTRVTVRKRSSTTSSASGPANDNTSRPRTGQGAAKSETSTAASRSEPAAPAAQERGGRSLLSRLEAVRTPDHPDLLDIRGITPEVKRRLGACGVSSVADIAGWATDDVRRIGARLGAAAHISKACWIEQATILARGGETAYKRLRANGAVGALVPPPRTRLPWLPRLRLASLQLDAGVDGSAPESGIADERACDPLPEAGGERAGAMVGLRRSDSLASRIRMAHVDAIVEPSASDLTATAINVADHVRRDGAGQTALPTRMAARHDTERGSQGGALDDDAFEISEDSVKEADVIIRSTLGRHPNPKVIATDDAPGSRTGRRRFAARRSDDMAEDSEPPAVAVVSIRRPSAEPDSEGDVASPRELARRLRSLKRRSMRPDTPPQPSALDQPEEALVQIVARGATFGAAAPSHPRRSDPATDKEDRGRPRRS